MGCSLDCPAEPPPFDPGNEKDRVELSPVMACATGGQTTQPQRWNYRPSFGAACRPVSTARPPRLEPPEAVLCPALSVRTRRRDSGSDSDRAPADAGATSGADASWARADARLSEQRCFQPCAARTSSIPVLARQRSSLGWRPWTAATTRPLAGWSSAQWLFTPALAGAVGAAVVVALSPAPHQTSGCRGGSANGLEVVLVEVARDLRAELGTRDVGGAEVDPGPDARVDVLLQRV